jgi:mono/diheme cytochrome c family protein
MITRSLEQLTVFLSAWLIAGTATFAQLGAPTANTDEGERLYVRVGCQECHGRVAQGAITGPRLASQLIPFESFLNQLRDPADEMPPYRPQVLSDQQAEDVFAYLQSIPAPPNPRSIPLLSDN